MKFAIKQKITIEVVEYIEAQNELDAHRLARNLLNDMDNSVELQFYDGVEKTEYKCDVEKQI